GSRSSMAPLTARVFQLRLASPQPYSPSWSVRTLTNIQLRISALTTRVFTPVILIAVIEGYPSVRIGAFRNTIHLVHERLASEPAPNVLCNDGIAAIRQGGRPGAGMRRCIYLREAMERKARRPDGLVGTGRVRVPNVEKGSGDHALLERLVER